MANELSVFNQNNQQLVEKITYLEQVICELESKNKRLTEMLDGRVYDKAQAYKENVLNKLLDKRQPGKANKENLDMQYLQPNMVGAN
jgi:hypothetical protein